MYESLCENDKKLDVEYVFHMYDTHGLPIEKTVETIYNSLTKIRN